MMTIILIAVLAGVILAFLWIAMGKIGHNWGRAHMDKWGIYDDRKEEHDDDADE